MPFYSNVYPRFSQYNPVPDIPFETTRKSSKGVVLECPYSLLLPSFPGMTFNIYNTGQYLILLKIGKKYELIVFKKIIVTQKLCSSLELSL